MTYNFKPTPEAIWFVLTTVVLIVLQAIVAQPTPPTDIQAWLIAIGGACLRGAVGAIIAVVTGKAAVTTVKKKRTRAKKSG